MPHSIFTGRPTPVPGEPLFLEDDTAAAIALAEEERDTCHRCGYPKVWCREPAHQFAFEPKEDVCWPTKRLEDHRESSEWKKKHASTQRATQLWAVFRDGHDPDIAAGLDLSGLDDGLVGDEAGSVPADLAPPVGTE